MERLVAAGPERGQHHVSPSLRFELPVGLEAPALVVVAHLRKLVHRGAGLLQLVDDEVDPAEHDHEQPEEHQRHERAPSHRGLLLLHLRQHLALDRGHLIADGYLLDVPTDYSGYVAENYDGRYRGRVIAR